MTKHDYLKMVKDELKRVNREIDKMILRAKPYGHLAALHRSLITRLNNS